MIFLTDFTCERKDIKEPYETLLISNKKIRIKKLPDISGAKLFFIRLYYLPHYPLLYDTDYYTVV